MWVQQPDASGAYLDTIALSQMTSMMHDADRNRKYHVAIRCWEHRADWLLMRGSAAIDKYVREEGHAPLVLDIGSHSPAAYPLS